MDDDSMELLQKIWDAVFATQKDVAELKVWCNRHEAIHYLERTPPTKTPLPFVDAPPPGDPLPEE